MTYLSGLIEYFGVIDNNDMTSIIEQLGDEALCLDLDDETELLYAKDIEANWDRIIIMIDYYCKG